MKLFLSTPSHPAAYGAKRENIVYGPTPLGDQAASGIKRLLQLSGRFLAFFAFTDRFNLSPAPPNQVFSLHQPVMRPELGNIIHRQK
jgi:hypothetical protein